jgi:hypothetical protein
MFVLHTTGMCCRCLVSDIALGRPTMRAGSGYLQRLCGSSLPGSEIDNADINLRAIDHVASELLAPELAAELTPAQLMGVIGTAASRLWLLWHEDGYQPFGQSHLGQMVHAITTMDKSDDVDDYLVSVVCLSRGYYAFDTEDDAEAAMQENWRANLEFARYSSITSEREQKREYLDLSMTRHPPFQARYMYQVMCRAVHHLAFGAVTVEQVRGGYEEVDRRVAVRHMRHLLKFPLESALGYAYGGPLWNAPKEDKEAAVAKALDDLEAQGKLEELYSKLGRGELY